MRDKTLALSFAVTEAATSRTAAKIAESTNG
jgi:hypothetical protein